MYKECINYPLLALIQAAIKEAVKNSDMKTAKTTYDVGMRILARRYRQNKEMLNIRSRIDALELAVSILEKDSK